MVTYQHSSIIFDKGVSSDFKRTFPGGFCTHSPSKQAKVHHIIYKPGFAMTRNLAVAQAAHYLDFANGNKSDHNPWQWNLKNVSYQFLWALLICITHYIGKVSTLSFQHCVADIGNLSKWPEFHLLAEEVGYWKSSSKGLNTGSCVTHTRMIIHF